MVFGKGGLLVLGGSPAIPFVNGHLGIAARLLAVDADRGQAYVGGVSCLPFLQSGTATCQLQVARYWMDSGTPDITYGNMGLSDYIPTRGTESNPQFGSMTFDNERSLYIAGADIDQFLGATNALEGSFLARLDTNGHLTSFVTWKFGACDEYPGAVSVGPSGAVYVSGTISAACNSFGSAAVVRIKNNLQDMSFGVKDSLIFSITA